MIVFFSSCELVEFHYHLFLQTLQSRSGAPASGQLPSASTPLKFLRLHGNMEQEVSTAPSPGVEAGASPPGSARPSLSDPTGLGGDALQAGDLPALEADPTAASVAWARASIVSVRSCSGSCPLPPERAHRPVLARVCLNQLLRQQSTTK